MAFGGRECVWLILSFLLPVRIGKLKSEILQGFVATRRLCRKWRLRCSRRDQFDFVLFRQALHLKTLNADFAF